MRSIPISFLCVLFCLSGKAAGEFTAYNDLAGSSSGNVTALNLSQSGLLKDYETGMDTPITLTVEGSEVASDTKSVDDFQDGDALVEFGTIVNNDGYIRHRDQPAGNPNSWVTCSFSGLNPNRLYTVVITGSRGTLANAYPSRTAIFSISDVESFVNESSAGAPWRGEDWVEFNTGHNSYQNEGFVARFTKIRCGNDGDMTIRVAPGPHNAQIDPADIGKWYLNQLKLVESGMPCNTPFADSDGDSDVDQADFAVFQMCLTGVGGGVPAGCECFDRDENGAGDGDIDQTDWDRFEACATGPGIASDPECEITRAQP